MELAGIELGIDLGPRAMGLEMHLSTFLDVGGDEGSVVVPSARQQLETERDRLMVQKMAQLRTLTVDSLTVTSTRQ